MVWYIFAFLYFILVDVLIFTQKWMFLVIALVAGAAFLVIALILRGLYPEKTAAPAPSTSDQYVQTPANPYQQTAQTAPVIGPDTRFSQAPQQQDATLPAVFFYIEVLIVLSLLVALFMKWTS